LCEQFDTFIVTHVPIMTDQDNAAAKRFIHFIDVLYDHHAKLVLSAAAPPHQLYLGTALAPDFQRTISRLIEMQGKESLS
jgi:cell division protein ZapE